MEAEVAELLAFKPEHLGWPAPADLVEQIGVDEAEAYLKERKILIEEAERDPLRYSYEPEVWNVVRWHIADLRKKFPHAVTKIVIWGGNRSGKSRFATNYVMRECVGKEGQRWWACDSTEAMARSNQMRLLWEQFPPEYRNLQRDQITKVRYSLADGFSENIVVFPNRSEISFKFYSMDVANLPGPELDGIYADELIPLEWIETLVYRLINRNGLLMITFTPELGWNDSFQFFYEGAHILQEVDAPLLPKYDEQGRQVGCTKVPKVMQCADPTARIIFFHTSENPFSNYRALVQQLKNKSTDEILIRAYGLATKGHSVAFPRFNHNAHVITRERFAAIQKEFPKGERYQLVDPCSGRNWFAIWIYALPEKIIIHREWPSHGHPGAYVEGVGLPGPWALSGAAADGVMGPAQKSFGFGLDRYIEEFLAKEKGEQILVRYIDSRYASAATLSRERTTTLIEQLAEAGMEFCGMTAESRILNVADGSIDLINSALYYDPEVELGKFSPELGRLNEPRLLVTEDCPNTIFSLEHWSGLDGQRGSCKDPIDCIRGIYLTSVGFVGENQYVWKSGGIPK